MKIAAYMPLLYGKEYAGYSIKSIYDCIDKVAIFYTQTPSYGYQEREAVNPDTKEELKKAVYQFGDPSKKIVWKEGWYGNEGQHRGAAIQWAEAEGYDILLACDYDEIWDEQELKQAIDFVQNNSARNYRVPMIHFWKDFNHICRDLAQPERFIKFKGEGIAYIPLDQPVYHFGYAISDELMKYKWSCHGHKNELRQGWFEKIWLSNQTKDVHPTNVRGFWKVENYDKNQLPEFMKFHPYWSKK